MSLKHTKDNSLKHEISNETARPANSITCSVVFFNPSIVDNEIENPVCTRPTRPSNLMRSSDGGTLLPCKLLTAAPNHLNSSLGSAFHRTDARFVKLLAEADALKLGIFPLQCAALLLLRIKSLVCAASTFYSSSLNAGR